MMKMFFKYRIAEPKVMEKLELDVFEKISKDSYARWIVPLVDDLIRKTMISHGAILDVGCGPGFLVKELSQRSRRFSVTGLDVSAYAISQAKRNCKGLKNAKFKVGSIYRLPFPTGSFDLVVCKDSFHQFPSNPIKVLQEMLRVVKKDGLIYIHDLRRDVPHYLLKRVVPPDTTFKKLLYYSARAAYTKKEMEGLIRKAGGKCVSIATRRVTSAIARRYQKIKVSPSALREAFQSRYVAILRVAN